MNPYASGTTKGFKDNLLASADYTYDANGNLTRDENKLMAITYNLLNLPPQALFDNGSYVTWLYDAAGVKLRKTTR